MKVYLIAGANGEALKQILQKGGEIDVVACDRNIEEAFFNLKNNKVEVDIIFLADQGINCTMSTLGRLLNDFSDLLSDIYKHSVFKFITKEPQYKKVFEQATGKNERFFIHFVDKIKIPVSLIKEICQYKNLPAEKPRQKQDSGENNLWSIFKRQGYGEQTDFKEEKNEEKKKQPEPEPEPEQAAKKRDIKIKNVEPQKSVLSSYIQPATLNQSIVSGNLNRLVLITGHRGAGATGTAANLGVEASSHGLRTIILDMDIEYRSMNLYFSKFGDEANLNPDLESSLIKCLLKPESYEVNSCRINENLWLSTMAYSIDSTDKMMDLITLLRLVTMVTILKLKFNLVIMDIPIHILRKYSELLIHADSVGLCVNNSLYSVINTVSSIGEFDKTTLPLMALKSRAIITKYNEKNIYMKKPITLETTCEILGNLSDVFTNVPDCAGAIPYTEDFDSQIDTGKKLCLTSEVFKNYYVNILNNLFR